MNIADLGLGCSYNGGSIQKNDDTESLPFNLRSLHSELLPFDFFS